MLCAPGAESTSTHGAIRADCLLTALLTSMPGALMLQHEAAKQDSAMIRFLRRTIGPVITASKHTICCALASSAVTHRQAEHMFNTIFGYGRGGDTLHRVLLEPGVPPRLRKRNRGVVWAVQ